MKTRCRTLEHQDRQSPSTYIAGSRFCFVPTFLENEGGSDMKDEASVKAAKLLIQLVTTMEIFSQAAEMG
jgi:hypothetical protein